MLDPKQIAAAEQSQAALVELLPPALWGFYSGCKANGFTEEQSMELTITLIGALLPGGSE